MRPGVVVLVVAAVLATTAGRCGPTAKTVVRTSGDDIGRATRWGQSADDLARQARTAEFTRNADVRFQSVATDLTASLNENRETVRKAVYSAAWDAFCDVADGKLPRDPDEVKTWLLEKAVSFGLEFLGDSAARLAGEVVAAAEGVSDAPSTCERLPQSGL